MHTHPQLDSVDEPSMNSQETSKSHKNRASINKKAWVGSTA
jgi:hypothetical protein